MKKLIIAFAMLSSTAFAADYSEYVAGEVAEVQPHYSTRVSSTPHRNCTQTQQSNAQPDMAMAIIGGVLGGVLGNQVGRGQGKTAATIGGTIIGSTVGGRQHRAGGGSNCSTSYSRHETTVVDYSDVTINIGNGRYFTKRDYSSRYRVGQRVRVRVGYTLAQ